MKKNKINDRSPQLLPKLQSTGLNILHILDHKNLRNKFMHSLT